MHLRILPGFAGMLPISLGAGAGLPSSLRRMFLAVFASLPLALPLASCEKAAEPHAEAEAEKAAVPALHVVLTGEQIKHLDVKTAVITAADYVAQLQGFGVVVRFDELAQAESEVETAEAAVRQSASALERTRKLNDAHFASAEALDAAKKQAETDKALLALAKRKEEVAFGRNAPWSTPAERRKIFDSLTKGEKSLVRVTFANDAMPVEMPGSISVRRLVNPQSSVLVKSELVWDAPADVSMPGRSVFALVPGGQLAEGERLLAFADSGAHLSGVLIPEAAIIMSDGKIWCYVAEAKGSFGRRPVDTTRPLPGGYFAGQGFRAGEAVVTQGQSLLLAYEMNPEGGEAE
jgi:hypothetical protein